MGQVHWHPLNTRWQSLVKAKFNVEGAQCQYKIPEVPPLPQRRPKPAKNTSNFKIQVAVFVLQVIHNFLDMEI
jgi:hypothetical protein